MSWSSLTRSEIRKLTTTKMPLGFVAVLIALATLNGVAVAVGTDMDGTKTFISTAGDQQSLIAFAPNALMIAGLFGAIAAAREFAHNTVIATFLVAPRRRRALGSQLAAVGVGGAALGLLGAALTASAVAVSLPLTDHSWMVPVTDTAWVMVASTWAGACGAVLGAAIGTVVRNTGGAVTGAVLVLVVAPPLVVQLASGTAPWLPSTLANVVSGVAEDISVTAAVTTMALWGLVPALIALQVLQRRDVV